MIEITRGMKSFPRLEEEGIRAWRRARIRTVRYVIEISGREFGRLRDLKTFVRDLVEGGNPSSMLRNFGYGVILYLENPPKDFEKAISLINTLPRVRGNWLWVVLAFPNEKKALGVHSYVDDDLTVVYADVKQQLADQGYRVSSCGAEPGKVMSAVLYARRFLNSILVD